MTTPKATDKKRNARGRFRLPDPPEREPDDMTSFDQLSATGNVRYLALHLGNQDTTLVAGEHYLVVRPTRSLAGSRYPDLLIAFGVDPAAYKESNGYIIDEQGKPPDFVLEIASARTGALDTSEKREDYQRLGITEYWRFDETGRHHGVRLAGDRLVEGKYEPVPIQELEDDTLQGYSRVLDLHIRWERGSLAWYDPATRRHIPTYEDERARADAERVRADAENVRADAEREARLEETATRVRAEARVAELEDELRRLRGP